MMGKGMLRCLFAVGLLCFCQAAWGKVSLRVEFGWEWKYQAGRWTPVFVTVSDSNARPARNVQLEIYAPQDDLYAMRVFQQFAIHPEPTTYVVYVPLTYQMPDTIAIIRDAETGRKLAEESFEQAVNPGGSGVGNGYASYADSGLLIGVSGRRSGLGILQGSFEWTEERKPTPPGEYRPVPSIRMGYLEAGRLPDAMVGYDGLDVLVLNGPDLVNMRPEQQAAIAGWVHSGGYLLMWAGEAPVPADNAIVKLLPCRIGTITATELSLAETKELGVAARVKTVGGREIDAAPGAKSISVFRDKMTAYYGRAGLGNVGVLSIDASQLVFENRDAAVNFWRPILSKLINPTEGAGPQSRYATVDYRRQRAMSGVLERLGDIPGVGKFDFSYIAIVMIGMMLVVGPIDWLVLKKLGRQPWTWATTAGWIVLLTTAALYIGHVFRSGDLHYRTLRMIDQAEGKVVGAMDVTTIYSPRTQRYQVQVPRDGWWKPATIGDIRAWRNSSRVPNELPALQDLRGNRPGGVAVNVWSLCFMEGSAGEPMEQPAMIEASLRRAKKSDSNEERIVGTITNQSGQTLTDLYIQTGAGNAAFPYALKANETVTVDLPLRKDDSLMQWRSQNGHGATTVAALRLADERQPLKPGEKREPVSAELGFAYAAGDLAPDRTDRIMRILKEEPNMACILAIAHEAAPTAKLQHGNREPAKEKHFQVIRALVAMEQVGQP